MTTLEKRRAELPAGEIAYVEAGEGPAVVLLHGFPTSSHLWRDLIPILAPRHRVVAPDLLGYGDSSRPDDPKSITVRAQAAHVRTLLDVLDVTDPGFVGHDIGGGIAQLLALEQSVRTLVLIDAISFDSWPIEGVRMLQGADPAQVDEEFVRGVVEMSLEIGMTNPGRLAREDRDEFVRPWLDEPMALVRAAQGIDGVGLAEREAELGELDSRALILWGEDDPFQPAELAERLGQVLPGATTALVPGASHFVTEDAPEAVLPLIAEYLRTHHLGDRHHHEGPTPVELGISFERPDGPSVPEGFEDLA